MQQFGWFLVILTLNNPDSMRDIFMYYIWFCIVVGGLAGLFLLVSVTLVDDVRDAMQEFTSARCALSLIVFTINSYILHTLKLDTTLVCYLVGTLIIYSAVGLGKLKSL